MQNANDDFLIPIDSILDKTKQKKHNDNDKIKKTGRKQKKLYLHYALLLDGYLLQLKIVD